MKKINICIKINDKIARFSHLVHSGWPEDLRQVTSAIFSSQNVSFFSFFFKENLNWCFPSILQPTGVSVLIKKLACVSCSVLSQWTHRPLQQTMYTHTHFAYTNLLIYFHCKEWTRIMHSHVTTAMINLILNVISNEILQRV